MSPARRTLVVVANEFFAPELGRMGGFGWAAHAASDAIREFLDDQLDVVYVSCEHPAEPGMTERTVHGRRMILVPGEPPDWRAALGDLRPDAFLTIDYRPSYAPLLAAFPEVPLLLWVRDPRPPDDQRKIDSLGVPGDPSPPQGVRFADCTTLGDVARVRGPRRLLRRGRPRPMIAASPAPGLLTPKAPATYGFTTGPLELLPNPVPGAGPARPASRPSVAFLARLDPIKRPWLVVEVARRLPDVDFTLLGQAHFEGPGSWQPGDLPPNVHALGHRTGAERDAALAGAWALLNPSIHEGFPVSFMEALAMGIPIVSSQDPEQATSRFGAYVGRFDGDGLEAVPALTGAVRDLVGDPARRAELGRAGRDWVRATHGPELFATALMSMVDRLAPVGLISRWRGRMRPRPAAGPQATPRTPLTRESAPP